MSAPGMTDRNTIVIERALDIEGRSLWTDARRRLVKNKAALTSIIVLSLIALVAIFVPFVWPYSYADIDYANIACAPNWWPDPNVPCYAGGYHIFGMDQNGRDLFVRVLYGARISLAVGVVATLVSLLIGVTYGAIAGFVGGRLDELMMRLVLKPKLIMLDEPVGGLAMAEVVEMIELLQQLKKRCSIFVIEHTMRVIRELADRVVVLIAGEKVADGPPSEILQNQRVIQEYLGTAHA